MIPVNIDAYNGALAIALVVAAIVAVGTFLISIRGIFR